MAKKDILEDHVIKKVRKIKNVDIVVGIPSYNNAKTISNVIGTFGEGIKKHYPGLKVLIVNSDGGSKDGTVDIVKKASLPKNTDLVVTRYKGTPGKGSSFRTIFEIAKRLNTKVCIVSDSDTRSINPDWMHALTHPVLINGYGYVTPYYTRDKHDGTITNALVYPMTRALYGLRIRQPIGGDFSFSNGALQIFTQEKHWKAHPHIAKFGIDIWMTTTAINEGFRVCQTVLGTKLHDVKDPGTDLAPMFKQVSGTMFELLRYYRFRWKNIVRSNQGFIFGDFKFIEVERIAVDFQALLDKFYAGYGRYNKVWEEIFEKDTFTEFKAFLESAQDAPLVIPVHLWAKMVYDYASLYNFINKDERDLLLESLIPLYYVRTASFVKEAEFFSDDIADAVVEGNAGVFERMKDYLNRRWDYFEKNNVCRTIKQKVIDKT